MDVGHKVITGGNTKNSHFLKLMPCI